MQQEHKSNLARVVFLQDVLDGDKILEGLRHLFAGDMKMARMPEIVYPVVTVVVCFTLGDFVVMVREPEIDSSRVYVNREAFDNRRAHGRAFNVPAWTALTPS